MKNMPKSPAQQEDLSSALDQAARHLAPLYLLLAQMALDPSQRQSSGAHLTDSAEDFVTDTLAALRGPGDLFAALGRIGDEIAALQKDAAALKRLSGHLTLLGRLCDDGYLRRQNAASIKAQWVHNWAQKEAEPLFNPDPHTAQQRLLALSAAARHAPHKDRKASSSSSSGKSAKSAKSPVSKSASPGPLAESRSKTR